MKKFSIHELWTKYLKDAGDIDSLYEIYLVASRLEKENEELKRKLAKWMPGKDGQALRAEMREKEPT